MTKTEAMQNAFGTMIVADLEKDVVHYMFNSTPNCYSLIMFTGADIEIAERVLAKFRHGLVHGLVDGTSMEIVELDSTFCIEIEWTWRRCSTYQQGCGQLWSRSCLQYNQLA